MKESLKIESIKKDNIASFFFHHIINFALIFTQFVS